ncbi:unnamed protein product, partial [Allacma fusca]
GMATPEEKKLLPVFRSRIQDLDALDDEDKTEKHLLRWLRARDLDVSKAEEMIRKSMDWRRQNRIDDSLLTFKSPAFYKQHYWISVTGYDGEGCPVIFAPFWDIRPVATSQRATFVRYVDQIIYKIATHCKARGITQFIIVFDLEGFEWKHLKSRAAIEVLLELVRNFEDNYPEALKSATAINAPKIFTILFNLIKPLLTARTLAKVQICGTNAEKWKAVLLDKIPSNRLPVKYGGILQDEDVPVIIDASFLPQSQTLRNVGEGSAKISGHGDGIKLLDAVEAPHRDGEEEDDWLSIQVGAGEKFDVELHVPRPDTLLRWSFSADNNDIGFVVQLKNGNTIVPYERREQQDGTVICSQPGIYLCTFDNTFSRFRAKLVKYLIQTVSSPKINPNLPL